MRSKLKYNLYRFKYNYSPKLALRTPVDVALELSSFCDMRCHYCYHTDQEKLPFAKHHMDYLIAKKIINDCAISGVSSLKFNWRGESTLNPKFLKIINFARNLYDLGAFVELISNTNFNFKPNPETFKALSRLTKVKISYDSFNKEVFEKQRLRGNHDRITSNIDTFYELIHRSKEPTEMVIQMVRTDENANEDMVSNIKKRWPLASYSIRDMVAGRNEQTTEGFKFVELDDRKPCLQAFGRLIFNHSGDAMMCCPDISEKLNLGNIKDKSVNGLFNSDKAKKLRASLKDKSAFLKDPCLTCSSYESYKGYKHGWGS